MIYNNPIKSTRNQSENSKYNLVSSLFNKIKKMFLWAYIRTPSLIGGNTIFSPHRSETERVPGDPIPGDGWTRYATTNSISFLATSNGVWVYWEVFNWVETLSEAVNTIRLRQIHLNSIVFTILWLIFLNNSNSNGVCVQAKPKW